MTPATPLRIVLISGSLRAGSANTAVLDTLADMAFPGARLWRYDGMAGLPHFNPDDDVDPLPPPVAALRAALEASDGVFLSTPEYAASLPGAFKNLLDWTIGGASLSGRPVGWINPSSHGGSVATYETLRAVLGMAGAEVVEPACVTCPVRRDAVGADGRIADPALRQQFAGAMQALIDRLRAG